MAWSHGHWWRVAAVIVIACFVLREVGCHGAAAPRPDAPSASTLPASAPSTQPGGMRVFQSASGFAVDYPDDWSLKNDPKFALDLSPRSASGDIDLTLQIPVLPMHIPGLIPIGSVASGYSDDFRKSHPGATTIQNAAHSLSDSKARLIHTTWRQGAIVDHDLAMLVVHGDHVYVLSVDCDSAQYARVRKAFDTVANSWRWIKP
jgi:hypothetical protein